MSQSLDGLAISAPQHIYLQGLNTKFRAYVGGFGSGKTAVGCLDQAAFAGMHPGIVQGYFAPTYRDIKDTFWPTMDEMGSLLGFRTVERVGDKEIELYRGRAYYGTIICRSMDSPNNIVGFKIARATVDEIDVMKKDKATQAWNKIIARMRLVVPGVVNGIGVTTTPEGFKFVYDRFVRNRKPMYSMVQASTYENERFLPPDYIPSLLETYPAELISAYLKGDFTNLTSGTVYRMYDRIANRSTETIKPKETLHIGQDFNVGQMASVIFVDRTSATERPGWHSVGELSGILDTPSLLDTLAEKFPDHKIVMYPDASGKSRKTVGASKSDISLIKAAGYSVKADDANPPVKDRVLAVNTGFSKSRLWVNDKACPRYADGLEQQAYDDNGEPDKSSGMDHHNDAGGYFVHKIMPITRRQFGVQELRL